VISAKAHIIWYVVALIVMIFAVVIVSDHEPFKHDLIYAHANYLPFMRKKYADAIFVAPVLLFFWRVLYRVAASIKVRCANSECPGPGYLVDDLRGIYLCKKCGLRYPGCILRKW
jgi:hypothetical protein